MRQTGFTLTELMVTMAIIGIISVALIVVMSNLNTQSERMNAQTELLIGVRQIVNLIKPRAALAGYRLGETSFDDSPMQITRHGKRVTFCYDLDAVSRQRIEFRVARKTLQSRVISNGECTPSLRGRGWKNISSPIVSNINFTINTNRTLDVIMSLEKYFGSPAKKMAATFRVRLPLYSISGQ